MRRVLPLCCLPPDARAPLRTPASELHLARCLIPRHLASHTTNSPAELRTAYEAAAHENQRLSGSLGELSRELQARDIGALERAVPCRGRWVGGGRRAPERSSLE